MKRLDAMHRRQLLLSAAALAAPAAWAQSAAYPSRPLRIVTPFAAGGAIDVLCRVIAERLATQLGQQVLVDPKPGASTIVGADIVAKAPADGYTLLITTSGTLISNVVFFNKLPYAPKDFVPITQISLGSVILVAAGNAPFGNLKELAAWAKTLGRPVSFASWGIGTSGHMFGELLKKNHGIELNHVPYRGDVQAYADVRGGTLDLAFGSPVSARPMIAAGHIKAVGMTGPRRPAAMPNLALFSEQGFNGFELAGFVAAYAPAGTPRAIVERLSAEFVKAIRHPEVTAKMLEQGQEPIANTPDEAERAYALEFPKWEAMIKSTGVTVTQQ
jgi:tripartite-type tricarboxylate transporter receptor subunit TctC